MVENKIIDLKTFYEIDNSDKEKIVALNKIAETEQIIEVLEKDLLDLRNDLDNALEVNKSFISKNIEKIENRIQDIKNRSTRKTMPIESLINLPKDIQQYIRTEEKESISLQHNLSLLGSLSSKEIKRLNEYTIKEKEYSNLLGKIKSVMLNKRLNLFFLQSNLSLVILNLINKNKNPDNVTVKYYEVNHEEKEYLTNFRKIYLQNIENNDIKDFYKESISDPIFFDFYNPLDDNNRLKVSRFIKTVVNFGFDIKFKTYIKNEVGKQNATVVKSELSDDAQLGFSNIIGSIYNPYSRVYLLNTLQRFLKLPQDRMVIKLAKPETYNYSVKHTSNEEDEYRDNRIVYTTKEDNDIVKYIIYIKVD